MQSQAPHGSQINDLRRHSVIASVRCRSPLNFSTGCYTVAISEEILAEAREKLLTKEGLRRWLGISDDEIERFLEQLRTICDVVPEVDRVPGAVEADPKDDKIIAAAVGRASYIVSEDRHLLDLGEYLGIKILSRDQFAEELDRLGVPPAP